jgi:hypothetical protein
VLEKWVFVLLFFTADVFSQKLKDANFETEYVVVVARANNKKKKKKKAN